MREILFRGKRVDNGEWVQGDLYHRNEEVLINNFHEGFNLAIIPETIGQYTGLTDKNGTKIFEGDILKFTHNKEDENPVIYSIEWKNDRGCYGYAETEYKLIEIDVLHCEVIGNIHDNPELLKGGGKNE